MTTAAVSEILSFIRLKSLRTPSCQLLLLEPLSQLTSQYSLATSPQTPQILELAPFFPFSSLPYQFMNFTCGFTLYQVGPITFWVVFCSCISKSHKLKFPTQSTLQLLKKSCKQSSSRWNRSWCKYPPLSLQIHTRFLMNNTHTHWPYRTSHSLQYHTRYKCYWLTKITACKCTLNRQVLICTPCSSRIECIQFMICIFCMLQKSRMVCTGFRAWSKSPGRNTNHFWEEGTNC